MYLLYAALGLIALGLFISARAANYDRELHAYARVLIVCGLIFACLGLFTGCASSTLGKSLNVGVVAAGTADLVSTRYAMQRGAVEANPLMGQSLQQQVIVKAVGVGTLLALTQLIEVKHPRIAHVIRGIAVIGWSAVSVHNVQVGR